MQPQGHAEVFSSASSLVASLLSVLGAATIVSQAALKLSKAACETFAVLFSLSLHQSVGLS